MYTNEHNLYLMELYYCKNIEFLCIKKNTMQYVIYYVLFKNF